MRPESKLAARPHFNNTDVKHILKDVEQVLKSGRLILGPHTSTLEHAFAEYVGTKHAVAVSSCTAALEIVLYAIAVRGKEVIVPSNTFVATVNAVCHTGGIPVFAEIGADFCIDVDHALSLINDKTGAVVVVHIAGFIPDNIELLVSACHRRNIPLIEDCAHAHGSTYKGVKAGALGHMGCFSFYPTKVMTCGVGGMLTTDFDEVAAYARSLRHHGQGSSLEDITEFGYDYLMDEIRAVVAYRQLRSLDEVVAYRQQLAARYNSLLDNVGEPSIGLVRPVKPTVDCEPAYYKYPVLLPEGVDRDAVRRKMMSKYGIETGAVYWPPVHLQPVYEDLSRAFKVSLPRTEALLRRQLCLPMHTMVDINDCEEIVGALRNSISLVSSVTSDKRR